VLTYPEQQKCQAACDNVLITARAELTKAFGDLSTAGVIANSSHGFNISMAFRCYRVFYRALLGYLGAV
jgi:hypothetical protein